MSQVVLDTNVASLDWKHHAPARQWRDLSRYSPVLTFVTVGELTKWTLVHRWGLHRRADMRAYIDDTEVLRYDRRVATKWGELAAASKRRGRPVSENDMWIAACCIVHDLPLATFNAKDFQDFAHRDGLVLMP